MRLGETATFVFFGVFDGHGGPYCAEHVVQISDRSLRSPREVVARRRRVHPFGEEHPCAPQRSSPECE